MKRGYGFSGRSVETRNTSNSVRDRLVRHMRDPSGDSTLNDSVVGDLFREAHGIEEGDEIDLESVEAWVNKIAGMGYVVAEKHADGWRLYFRGTRNECYPGERFATANEARNFHAVRLLKGN